MRRAGKLAGGVLTIAPPAPLVVEPQPGLVMDRLREFLKVASQDAILVSIKTRIGHLTEDPDTAIELCQAAPGIGLTLDPSYYLCGPHRGAIYDQVYPFVYHTHLRDTTPDQIQVPVGLGQIDYSRVISQLLARVVSRHMSLRSARNSSQVQAMGLATGMETARSR